MCFLFISSYVLITLKFFRCQKYIKQHFQKPVSIQFHTTKLENQFPNGKEEMKSMNYWKISKQLCKILLTAMRRFRKFHTLKNMNSCVILIFRHETILFRVFERVSGVDLETKFNSTVDIPKAEGNTKEEKQKVKTKREQIRRSKQDICYTELGNFVHKNRLGNTEQR